MRQQEFHLIGQVTPALQVDVFSVSGRERYGQQFYSSLFRCASGFVVITALAGSDHIHPAIRATLAQWFYMVPRQQEIGELLATVQAQALVAAEQGLVAQGRSVGS